METAQQLDFLVEDAAAKIEAAHGEGVRLIRINGSIPSMKNTKSIVFPGGDRSRRPMLVNSKTVHKWVENAVVEARARRWPGPLLGPVQAYVWVTYRSKASDLDVELLFDAMEKFAYENDNQIVEKHLYKLQRAKGATPGLTAVFFGAETEAKEPDLF